MSIAEEIEIVESLASRIFPLMRSITGEGLRETLRIFGTVYPVDVLEVPSGSKAFDWIIPKEWVFRSAKLWGPDGKKILDAADHNLHVMNYSMPFEGTLSLEDLSPHLYSDPKRPTAIPYVTSYYKPNWGFCLPHEKKQNLPKGTYKVSIDTEHKPGSLTIGEINIPGTSSKTAVFSSYICHPSMVNDELCGAISLLLLAGRISRLPQRRISCRIVFPPETIGTLAYLQKRGEDFIKEMVAGFNVCNVSTQSPFVYKRSRKGNELPDRIMELFGREQNEISIERFTPLGSDERQYCSPGFNLPFGALSRGPTFFPEYHSSLDDMNMLDGHAVVETANLLEKAFLTLDRNHIRLKRTSPFGEPQLGKYDLYPSAGGSNHTVSDVHALLWILNQCDGSKDLIEIAHESGLPFETVYSAAKRCTDAGLLLEQPAY